MHLTGAVGTVGPDIRPDDVSSLVNPASTGANQARAWKIDGLEFAWPVPHKRVECTVGVATKGTD